MFSQLYLLTLPIFFAIDLVWLGVVAKPFYGKHLGFLMSPSPNWTAAVLFYLLFIAGLVFLSYSRRLNGGIGVMPWEQVCFLVLLHMLHMT